MITNINGKDYKLTKLEGECLNEMLHAIRKFGKDKFKCLDWGTFGHTLSRRKIFYDIWEMVWG